MCYFLSLCVYILYKIIPVKQEQLFKFMVQTLSTIYLLVRLDHLPKLVLYIKETVYMYMRIQNKKIQTIKHH